MRTVGVSSNGVRLPIISRGDDLVSIVFDSVKKASEGEQRPISKSDIIGVTEAIVAKSDNNFVTIEDINADIKAKFQGDSVGVVFPVLSRNRFLNVLKGIVDPAHTTYVLLNFPFDEMGNPIMDEDILDDVGEELRAALDKGPIPIAEFRKIVGPYKHYFTGIDYAELYALRDNVKIYVSNDPRHILKLTNQVLVCETHKRFKTAKRIKKVDPSANVLTLSDIMAAPIGNSGCNPEFGVLGSNLSKDNELKLFPRNSADFIAKLKARFEAELDFSPELLVYGDGAFKDPVCGIWELCDPVVSPAYTERLSGTPNEIKIKYVAENVLADDDNKEQKMKELITEKNKTAKNGYNDGTTPRRYHDLVGSLCDLTSGSGDKGTPVIWIRGYFDDFTTM